MYSRSWKDRHLPDSGARASEGIPPRSRKQPGTSRLRRADRDRGILARETLGDLTPSTPRRKDGAPGDFIAGLPVNAFIHPAGPTRTSTLEVLGGPVESAQFRSSAFVRALKDHGLIGSMGRVGACGDNAAIESFFALLQKNVLNRQRSATRDELRLAIITWIERTYHRRRRQRRLGRLTPIEYETLTHAAAAA